MEEVAASLAAGPKGKAPRETAMSVLYLFFEQLYYAMIYYTILHDNMV